MRALRHSARPSIPDSGAGPLNALADVTHPATGGRETRNRNITTTPKPFMHPSEKGRRTGFAILARARTSYAHIPHIHTYTCVTYAHFKIHTHKHMHRHDAYAVVALRPGLFGCGSGGRSPADNGNGRPEGALLAVGRNESTRCETQAGNVELARRAWLDCGKKKRKGKRKEKSAQTRGMAQSRTNRHCNNSADITGDPLRGMSCSMYNMMHELLTDMRARPAFSLASDNGRVMTCEQSHFRTKNSKIFCERKYDFKVHVYVERCLVGMLAGAVKRLDRQSKTQRVDPSCRAEDGAQISAGEVAKFRPRGLVENSPKWGVENHC